MQCRARFHVYFSETEGNFALYWTISFTFPSMQSEGNTTFFLVGPRGFSCVVPHVPVHTILSQSYLRPVEEAVTLIT